MLSVRYSRSLEWKLSFKLKILICLFTILFSNPVISNENVSKIVVKVNQSKVNDSVWDGLGGATAGGKFRFGIPTSGPPDIIFCEVHEEGEKCYKRNRDGKVFSNCHNSYDCSFDVNLSSEEIVGMIFIDLDKKNHDLIDAAIFIGSGVTESELNSKRSHWDNKLRKRANEMSATFTEGEVRRRERRLPVCHQAELKCELFQSHISWE